VKVKRYVDTFETLASGMTLGEAHSIAEQVPHQLQHHLNYLSIVVIHVDPEKESGSVIIASRCTCTTACRRIRTRREPAI
jgi:divalent metal cation (Fe/Co/Zn/Cd) transporter